MPYPYGMYNAPTIGNGLGGLPRKAIPAAVASIGVPQLNRVGTPFNIVNGLNYQYPTLRMVGTKNNICWFGMTYTYSSANYYELRRAVISGDSITSAPAVWSSTTTSYNFRYGASDVADDGTLYVFGDDNTQATLTKYDESGRTVISTTIATSGTITDGSRAGQTWSNSYNVYNVESTLDTLVSPSFRLLNDGTGLLIRAVTLSGVGMNSVIAQKINITTGATLKTIELFTVSTNSYYIDGVSVYLKKYDADNFTFFMTVQTLYGGSTPYLYAYSGAFNATSFTLGTVYSAPTLTPIGAARTYNGAAILPSSSGSLIMRVQWANYARINFPINSTGLPNATPTLIATSTGTNASDTLTGRYIDRTYNDVFGGNPSYPPTQFCLPEGPYDAPVNCDPTLRVKTAIVTSTTLSATNEVTGVSGNVSYITPKAIIANDVGDDTSVLAPPYTSPWYMLGRVSEYSFVCAIYDRKDPAPSGTRLWLQIIKA